MTEVTLLPDTELICVEQTVFRSTSRPGPWLFGNLLCLDAPLVAAGWLWLFATCFGLSLPHADLAALFCTVWLIYLVDRFFDSLSVSSNLPRSARQIFCRDHRNVWLGLIVFASLLEVAILFSLDRSTILRGVLLGSFVCVYLAVNSLCNKIWKTVPLKEILIGFLFSAGTFLPLSGHSSAPMAMFAGSVLFALLCSFNCISIAAWERELDRIQDKHSIASRLNRISFLRIVFVSAVTAGCPILIAINFRMWPVAACAAVSLIALAGLDFFALSRDDRIALADLVLLTPIVFFAINHLR